MGRGIATDALGATSTNSPEPACNVSRSRDQAARSRSTVGRISASSTAALLARGDWCKRRCRLPSGWHEAGSRADAHPGPDDRPSRRTRLAVLPALRPVGRRPAATTGNDLTRNSPSASGRFEIVMARQMAKGELQTTWFERHGSTPITEIPTHWPAAYRKLVERRIKLIETNKEIGLIEKPEYKRRWNAEPWDEQEQRALKNWLLDRLEDKRYWPSVRTDNRRLDWPTGQRRRRVHASGGALPRPTRLRRGRSGGRTGRGRVGPVPAGPAVQALGPAEAGGLGTDLGSAAPRRTPGRTWATSRCRPSTPRPTS